MKGERFDIFYARVEFTTPFRNLVYAQGKDLADSVFCLKDEAIHHNVLLLDDHGPYPMAVFLRPDLEGQMKKKAKDCCDKSCSSCVLGCVDTPAAGFLIKERMKSYFKKEGHLREFYADTAATLEDMRLEGYTLENHEIVRMAPESVFGMPLHKPHQAQLAHA
ncbi:hypothetical protein QPK87_15015 [Kamptonema cortianum]|nr:hypothetical protein [Oscillatoria laete-virens]MDK3157874.1 hypothetical protein [Kamptonema cortianum]MDL5046004.1 hypothetical protein [Oscillatoria amoena NRMC-F 0135]MDL5052710.1 hypothetical protein [Oscillatoria laete-virens NRMC-F 0139]